MAYSMRLPFPSHVPTRHTTKARASSSNRTVSTGQASAPTTYAAASPLGSGMPWPAAILLLGAATLPVYLFGKNHAIMNSPVVKTNGVTQNTIPEKKVRKARRWIIPTAVTTSVAGIAAGAAVIYLQQLKDKKDA